MPAGPGERYTTESRGRPERFWSTPGIKPTATLIFLAFAGWSLLISVVPLAVLDGGGSNGLAGATTGVFMAATVVTQIFTPKLLSLLGYRVVLALGSGLLGIPAVVHAITLDPVPVLAIAVIRGVGFGLMTVSGIAMVVELVRPDQVGRATGTVGVSIGVAEVVFLPGSLWVYGIVGADPVFYAAAVFGVVGLLLAGVLPRVFPASQEGTSRMGGGRLLRLLIVPSLTMSAVSFAFGGFTAFLPAAFAEVDGDLGSTLSGIALSLVGVTMIIARYVAGHRADRAGPGFYLVPGLLVGALGAAGVGLVVALGLPVWIGVVFAAVYGLGFGSVQAESLISSTSRLPKHKLSTASAVWNIAFDSGTGAGSFVLGFIAARGYEHTFWVASGVLLAVGMVVIATRAAGVEPRPKGMAARE